MKQTRQIIESEWQAYRRQVVPANAPEVQMLECRRAFWAGASSLFGAIMNILEPGTEATEADLDLMTAISEELKAFVADVKRGAA
jgi:hypothetical protein